MNEALDCRIRRYYSVIASLFSLVLLACSPSSSSSRWSDGAPPSLRGLLDDGKIRVSGELLLDETADVVNVEPNVAPNTPDGFLIADPAEDQVRLYSSDGVLNAHFGQPGKGPLDLEIPVRARRFDKDRILVVQAAGGIKLYSKDGMSLEDWIRPDLRHTFDVLRVGPERLVIAGLDSLFLLHFWDLNDRRIVSRAFPIPSDSIVRQARAAFWLSIAARADTIAAAFSLDNAIHLFDSAGTTLSSIALPSNLYRRIETPIPLYGGAAAVSKWLDTVTLLTDLYWINHGFLVQYAIGARVDRRFALVAISSDGRVLFEATNTPRLMFARDNRLFFGHPDSDTPDRWLIAEVP